MVDGGKPGVDSRNGGEAYWKEQSVIRRSHADRLTNVSNISKFKMAADHHVKNHYYYFNTIKLQILYKQNWLQFLFVVKTTALNSKYQNFIHTFCIF